MSSQGGATQGWQENLWGILVPQSCSAKKRFSQPIRLTHDVVQLGRLLPESADKSTFNVVISKRAEGTRSHCCIKRGAFPGTQEDSENKGCKNLIKDVSDNGTFVNRTRLPKGEFRVLESGAVISLATSDDNNDNDLPVFTFHACTEGCHYPVDMAKYAASFTSDELASGTLLGKRSPADEEAGASAPSRSPGSKPKPLKRVCGNIPVLITPEASNPNEGTTERDQRAGQQELERLQQELACIKQSHARELQDRDMLHRQKLDAVARAADEAMAVLREDAKASMESRQAAQRRLEGAQRQAELAEASRVDVEGALTQARLKQEELRTRLGVAQAALQASHAAAEKAAWEAAEVQEGLQRCLAHECARHTVTKELLASSDAELIAARRSREATQSELAELTRRLASVEAAKTADVEGHSHGQEGGLVSLKRATNLTRTMGMVDEDDASGRAIADARSAIQFVLQYPADQRRVEQAPAEGQHHATHAPIDEVTSAAATTVAVGDGGSGVMEDEVIATQRVSHEDDAYEEADEEDGDGLEEGGMEDEIIATQPVLQEYDLYEEAATAADEEDGDGLEQDGMEDEIIATQARACSCVHRTLMLEGPPFCPWRGPQICRLDPAAFDQRSALRSMHCKFRPEALCSKSEALGEGSRMSTFLWSNRCM
ncbi:hypothetical protein CYMTET_34823 [Cymbomonas tetramitiformis]|uniref:FHA domain-containing protein n=1 Tax=Cymbomonas tetramitiformis TaxID=36881 RepID=A0AAE0KPK9_9CHLO|nr:hypothetical protein CYMTET_34823 [Cymbomonas tetramitiformis]